MIDWPGFGQTLFGTTTQVFRWMFDLAGARLDCQADLFSPAATLFLHAFPLRLSIEMTGGVSRPALSACPLARPVAVWRRGGGLASRVCDTRHSAAETLAARCKKRHPRGRTRFSGRGNFSAQFELTIRYCATAVFVAWS